LPGNRHGGSNPSLSAIFPSRAHRGAIALELPPHTLSRLNGLAPLATRYATHHARADGLNGQAGTLDALKRAGGFDVGRMRQLPHVWLDRCSQHASHTVGLVLPVCRVWARVARRPLAGPCGKSLLRGAVTAFRLKRWLIRFQPDLLPSEMALVPARLLACIDDRDDLCAVRLIDARHTPTRQPPAR
jgi:hypothetical protein